MTSPSPAALMDELRACGDALPQALRDRFVAEGAPLVQALIDAVLDNDDGDDESGWASIHAVDLLCDLKAEAAIAPMLRVLTETDWEHIIHDRIVLRLPDLGAPVLEPALSMLTGAPAGHVAEALCAIVANLGVRDERIFVELKSRFAENPDMGSGWLADYGDERALPLLEHAIEDTVPEVASAFGLHPLVEHVEAYERLAGGLPVDLRLLADERIAAWKASRPRRPTPRAAASAPRVGRNDPCPCGSGKKYKRCHLGADGA